MAQPYCLLLLTDNISIQKQIDSLTQSMPENPRDIVVDTNTTDLKKYDAILVAQDKIACVSDKQYACLPSPFIYLNAQGNQLQDNMLLKTKVDEIIDMNKITATGFSRAVQNTIEKFYINNELNTQKEVLRKLSGITTQEGGDVKAHGCALTESSLSTKNLIEDNKKLIDLIQAQNEELKKVARVDILTKIGNRLSFEEMLTLMISHAKRHKHMFALLMIDVDKFKNVNDSYGHQMGDVLLKAVAEKLQSAVRKSDFVARVGGDEFAVILNEIKNPHAAGIVAWKIIQEVSKPILVGLTELRIEVSIGIACFPLIGDNFEDLIKNADMAMYQAKKSHLLKYVFANMQVHSDLVKKIKMEDELKRAIDRDELTMVYQPIYKIPSQQLHGFEALIRWNNKNLGHISPAEFIPIAEDSGLIFPITAWVLKAVCKQISIWRSAHEFPYKISVNLSPSQLVESELLQVVTDIISTYQIPLDLIEFEITEMAAMQENPEASATLKSLCAMGASHALDDFGTGYSSIKHLRLLPISTIKIDQSFIQGLGIQKADESIVSSIISLAKKMGLKVVAEGVETEQQLKFLLDEKCDFIQGYLFSKPLTADIAQKLLGKKKL